MLRIIMIIIAGGLGALTRYGLGELFGRLLGRDFPWGTWAANLVGCFLFGLVWMLAEQHLDLSPEARLIILTGFLGGLTTFSSFIHESGTFLRTDQMGLTLLNIGGQVVLGLAVLFAGIELGRLVASG